MDSQENNLLFLIILSQVVIFLFAVYKTYQLRALYPKRNEAYSIVDFNEELEDEGTELSRIDTIGLNSNLTSAAFEAIVSDTNNYLIHNAGEITSFELIKNISERSNDKLERSIKAVIPVPLYIGLMGTMLGIVLGLSGMGDLNDLENASMLTPLLTGVKIAMIGSVSGLLLTLVGSAIFYRGAKFKRDERRNSYYNFIQNNLMPALSADAGSTIAKNLMQIEQNMARFNSDFQQNTHFLKETADGVLHGVANQVKYAEAINQIDFATAARSIERMYGGIAKNLEEFKKFNAYQETMNTAVVGITQSMNSAKEVFEKVTLLDENLIGLATKFSDQIVVANEAMTLIKSQYQGIESVSDFTKSLLSEQQQNLKMVYTEFRLFLDETKEQFSDWAKSSVSESKHEIKALSDQVSEEITSTLNTVKNDIKKVYSSDSMVGIKKDIAALKSTVAIVSKSQDSIEHVDKAIDKMNVSIDQLSQLSQSVVKMNKKIVEVNYKDLILKTLIQALVFGLVIAAVWLVYTKSNGSDEGSKQPIEEVGNG